MAEDLKFKDVKVGDIVFLLESVSYGWRTEKHYWSLKFY